MASEAAGANQGATEEHLSDGQTNGAGAPKAPPVDNTGAGGDGVHPKDADDKGKKPEDDPKPKDNQDATDEDEDDEDEKPVLTEWTEFDDPSANAAIDLLKEAGVTPAEADKIFAKAIESNDLRDIDVAELEAKVGKTKALLIMNGVQDYYTRTVGEHEKTVTMVKDVFGGDSGWETVKTWAQAREKTDKAFKKELDGIREDLNRGGRAAKAAAKDLLKLYNGNPNTKGLGTKTGKLTKGDGKPAPSGQPLSRADYLTQLKKAHSEGASSAVIADLDRRRLAGKQQGI